MMNVVETICIEAVASLRRWLQGVVLTVCIGQRSQRLRSAFRRHAERNLPGVRRLAASCGAAIPRSDC
jgi:hypothetical protein